MVISSIEIKCLLPFLLFGLFCLYTHHHPAAPTNQRLLI